MKFRIVISLCLIVAILCACSGQTSLEFEKYKLYKEDGKWYLEVFADKLAEVHKETEDSAESNAKQSVMAGPPVAVQTASELREKIIGGGLTDSELARFREACKNDICEICDPYKIKDLAMPDDLKQEYVIWNINHYAYAFQIYDYEENQLRGEVYCGNKDKYDGMFSKKYENFLEEYRDEILSETVVSDRNARVVYSTDGEGLSKNKNVFYKLKTRYGDTLYVQEDYTVAHKNHTNVSETVPVSIHIFGSNGKDYYCGWFAGFKDRPSVEWLQSFGIKQ